MDGCLKVPTDSQAACRLASQIKRQWRSGRPPDVAEALEQHPQLKQHKSIVLDLACDEYQERLRSGEAIDAEEFSRRFPTLQRSLQLLIFVRGLLGLSQDDIPGDESAPWPEPGHEFLGFALLDEIGRGAFARVFLARERALGNRLVALKVARHGSGEAEMLGRLQHPHIVPIYSVQEDPDTSLTAVCMPFLGRTTVCDVFDQAFAGSDRATRASVILDAIRRLHDASELCEAPPAPRIVHTGSYVDGVVFLAERIADALGYTHARGICHCDLKPSNVLISIGARPLLLDFNLSLEKGADRRRLGGTIPYMAPEQLRLLACDSVDCPGPADPRSDLFSLGVIVYELLSGQLPFGPIHAADSLEAIAEDLLQRQAKGPTPIRGLNGQVGRRLAETIEACLAWDPDRRPQSAAELALAFRKELLPLPRAKGWARCHRRSVAGALLGAFLIAAALLVFLWVRPPYELRQLRQGLQYMEQAAYERAIESFDNAIRVDPDCSEALIARGRAYLKLNRFPMAVEDFRAVLARESNAPAAASLGYCLNRLRYHEHAIEYYSLAVKLGFSSAGILNNMGYSCRQLERRDEAIEYLTLACERDPALQAAHYNLAAAYLRQALAGGEVNPTAYLHIQKAIQLGPASADLFHTAAMLSMLRANDDPSATDRAIEYLEKARVLGLSGENLRSTPQYRSLHGRARFEHLLDRAPDVTPVPPDLIVDPL